MLSAGGVPATMPTWKPMWSRNPKYELTLTGILPSFAPSGERFVYTTRPAAGAVLGASLAIAKTGVDKADIIYKDDGQPGSRRGPQYRGGRVIPAEGRALASDVLLKKERGGDWR